MTEQVTTEQEARRLKIVFDARYVRTDFHDGISRYSTELGRALQRIADVTLLVSDERQLAFFEQAPHLLAPEPQSLREPLTALLVNKARPDVAFSPLQVMGGLGRRFRLILTLQDLIYYRHRRPPYGLKPIIRIGWFLYHLSFIPQRLNLRRADMVSTISQTSKQEIIATGLAKEPIIVVANAPRDLAPYLPPGAEVRQSETPPRNLIYMGSCMPYKNPDVLVRGMALLPGRTLHLLSSLPPERESELRALMAPDSDVVFHHGVSDEQYASLLADDAILVTGTLDEGFGLPPTEALQFGVPVVVSDLPVLHEVVGQGGEYFDPRDPSDFAAAVRRLDDLSARMKRVAAGREHVAQYTWDASARALVKGALRLLGGSLG